ncbi:MAG: nucleotidyl transferase AbiEii/AbiGii toxin family protein [Bacteroidales bacterium]|jgi:hypothetical protein|nr:nucleotidyl transferase AbiEii/AbiGii toxin family protein [Bacteroidales bacterium]
MLHKETVEPTTLDLIRKLQTDPELDGFSMAGGTALALFIGHRISIDIDLFSQNEFDAAALSAYLEQNYRFSLQYIHRNTLKGFIEDVFVDILTHPYPLVAQPVTEENISLLSKQDIAAMKVNAISGNGTRAKDFVDLYFLLNEFSMSEILGFYTTKYAQQNTFHALKSLTFFEDIDAAVWPRVVAEPSLTLKMVQDRIREAQKQFLKDNLR